MTSGDRASTTGVQAPSSGQQQEQQPPLERSSTTRPEVAIRLVDHTKRTDGADDLSDSEREGDTERAHTRDSTGPADATSPLSTKLRHGSLREGIARRKYAKWQEDPRENVLNRPNTAETGTSSVARTATATTATGEQAERESLSLAGPEGSGIRRAVTGGSILDRGRRKVRGMLRSRKTFKDTSGETAAIDVLYENQRGSFFFGIPFFSQNSLLHFDPKPWVNGEFHPSPVDITNAQPPDPGWRWAWASWYVDMSRDVDEEGWEYSFSFQKGFSWHGTHPWFHSFVRRRRWLRKRVRCEHPAHVEGATTAKDKAHEAHMLNPEYFTIHPNRDRSPGGSSIGTSVQRSSYTGVLAARKEEELPVDDVRDIATLMRGLKKAAIDREKMVLVSRFLEHGEEELYYLGEQMPSIMSLFVFQNSRRQLLTLLMQKLDAASRHRQEHVERGQGEDAREKRRIDNMLRAIEAADREVRKLEYWSDIRDVVRKGDAAFAADEDRDWGHGWCGLDGSGPEGGPGTSPAAATPEGGRREEEVEEKKGLDSAFEKKGKEKEASGTSGDEDVMSESAGGRDGSRTRNEKFRAEDKGTPDEKGTMPTS